MKKKQSGEMATAYHESGHAVASRIVWPKVAVRHVTIIPDPERETLGHCLHRKPGKNFQPDIEITTKTRNRLEAEVISLLAGGIAEQRFTGKKSKGSLRDLSNAATLASNMENGKVLDAYLDYLWARTEELVHRPIYWECIGALAEKLIAERRVSGRDVDNVIRAVLDAELEKHRRNNQR